jgi:predicted lipoprotein with Yx(FWY)xxD motif
MKRFSACCLIAILLCAFPEALNAQWSNDPTVNTPVCLAIDKQVDLRMMKDGTGGVYVVWKDFRAGISDVYMQRLSASGVPMWALQGLPICTDAADQSTPAITTDMAGGAIITWSDWRSGIERDIYAQRVDSNGNILWAADGVIVTNKTAREHNPKIISDNAGGAIVSWEQQSGGLWDVWAQRISGSGTPVWAAGGVPLCNVTANRINPKIQDDGVGGAVVVWQDERSGEYDVYAQRIDKSGMLQWGTGAKLVCAAAGAQTDPKIDPDSSHGAYIVWIDRRSFSNYDVYAQRVDSNGNAMWPTDGVPVCDAPGSQTAQDIMSNSGTGGLIVAWKDKRSSDYDIYAQKLSDMGVPQWAANGVPVCSAIKDQLNPNIIEDKYAGAIIVWQDSSGGSFDIKAQRLDANGVASWLPGGEKVGTAFSDQISVKNVTDDNGGSIFAFQDKRSGFYDIYAHHLYADGTTIAPNGIAGIGSLTEMQCYPNPFFTDITISFTLNDDDPVMLTGYDVTGRIVEAFTSAKVLQEHGRCTVHIDLKDKPVAPGIYFLKLYNDKGSKTIRVIRQSAN